MDTLVIFYSFTGRTHYEAKCIAEELGAERYEVEERKYRSMISANVFGRIAAGRRSKASLKPIAVNMEDYDKIVIMSPVWGGYPAPAFNSIVGELPEGKRVEVVLTSDSGRASRLNGIRKLIEARGCNLQGIKVLKTIDLKKRDRLHAKKLRKEQNETE